MAAVNGEIFVTDKLVASGGAVRDETVANGSVVASKVMVKGNAEERLQVPANGGEETFFSPVKMVANGESEFLTVKMVAGVEGVLSPGDMDGEMAASNSKSLSMDEVAAGAVVSGLGTRAAGTARASF